MKNRPNIRVEILLIFVVCCVAVGIVSHFYFEPVHKNDSDNKDYEVIEIPAGQRIMTQSDNSREDFGWEFDDKYVSWDMYIMKNVSNNSDFFTLTGSDTDIANITKNYYTIIKPFHVKAKYNGMWSDGELKWYKVKEIILD